MWRFLLICVFSVIVAFELNNHQCSAADRTSNTGRDEQQIVRLLDHIVPKHYDLWIKTEIEREKLEFTGRVNIDIDVTGVTNHILLHGKFMIIRSVEMWDINTNVGISLFEPAFDSRYNLIILQGREDFPLGEYRLEINYEGKLRDDNLGFYYSKYKNLHGKTVYLAATQFEPIEARHAFPCFDEPQLKTTFQITIEHACIYNAVSNTYGVTSPSQNSLELCKTKFDPTPVMSTYLVAFIISDLKQLSSNDGRIPSDSVRHRVFATEQKLSQSNFTLHLGEEILNEYELYTELKYPIDKMDHIAIPDYRFGAMENYGLITYAEKHFCVDPEREHYDRKEHVAGVIAHELAHQWFGNLVTLEWWEYVWLNEGFSTLYSCIILDRLFDYNRMDSLGLKMQEVMQYESGGKSRPLNHKPVEHSQIKHLFDQISYFKAAAILRMMMYALTEDVFKQGINDYLHSRQYASANPGHLYAALQRAVDDNAELFENDINIQDIFLPWTTQKGFPLVTVKLNHTTGELTITQQQYLTTAETACNGTLWWIPYSFIISSDEENDISSVRWTNESTSRFILEDLTEDAWVVIDTRKVGYYRVNYDLESWYEIIKEFKDPESVLDHEQRAQLVDDAFDLAYNRLLPYKIPLKLLTYLKSAETNFIVWETALASLSRLNAAIYGAAFYERFLKYVQSITKAKFNELKTSEIENESYHENKIRRHILKWACKSRLSSCLRLSREAFKEHISGETEISAYLRATIVANGILTCSEDEFWGIWRNLAGPLDVHGRSEVIAALSETTNKEMRWQFLKTVIIPSGEMVKEVELTYTEEDRVAILVFVMNSTPSGCGAVVELLDDYAPAFKNVIKNGSSFQTILKSLADLTVHEKHLSDFFEVIGKYSSLLQDEDIKELKATAIKNVEWLKRSGADIEAWLVANHYDDMDKASEKGGTPALQNSVVASVLSVIIVYFSKHLYAFPF